MKTYEVSITIDCRPATPKPYTYLQGALNIIKSKHKTEELNGKIVSKFFGAWTWEFTEELEINKEDAMSELKLYFETLEKSGCLTYASWGLDAKDTSE